MATMRSSWSLSLLISLVLVVSIASVAGADPLPSSISIVDVGDALANGILLQESETETQESFLQLQDSSKAQKWWDSSRRGSCHTSSVRRCCTSSSYCSLTRSVCCGSLSCCPSGAKCVRQGFGYACGVIMFRPVRRVNVSVSLNTTTTTTVSTTSNATAASAASTSAASTSAASTSTKPVAAVAAAPSNSDLWLAPPLPPAVNVDVSLDLPVVPGVDDAQNVASAAPAAAPAAPAASTAAAPAAAPAAAAATVNTNSSSVVNSANFSIFTTTPCASFKQCFTSCCAQQYLQASGYHHVVRTCKRTCRSCEGGVVSVLNTWETHKLVKFQTKCNKRLHAIDRRLQHVAQVSSPSKSMLRRVNKLQHDRETINRSLRRLRKKVVSKRLKKISRSVSRRVQNGDFF